MRATTCRLVAAGLSVLLAGCGVSSVFIKAEALNFGQVIEDTTNKLLVMNVLRARDKAPLHFADIPVVRESIQQSASVGVLQYPGQPPPHAVDRHARPSEPASSSPRASRSTISIPRISSPASPPPSIPRS